MSMVSLGVSHICEIKKVTLIFITDKGWATYRDKLAHEEKFLYGLLVSQNVTLPIGYKVADFPHRW